MARVEITECYPDYQVRFYSDGTVEIMPYRYENGYRIIDLDPNKEIFGDD